MRKKNYKNYALRRTILKILDLKIGLLETSAKAQTVELKSLSHIHDSVCDYEATWKKTLNFR